MGKISDRIEGSVENWTVKWGERLKSFSSSVIRWGFEIFFDVVGKAAAPKFKPFIDKIEATAEIPPELKPIFDELKSPTGQVAALFAQSAGGALVGGAVGKLLDWLLRPLVMGLSTAPGFMILDPPQLLALWRRGFIGEVYLNDHLHWLGFGDDDIAQLKSLTEVRLDPATVVTLRRRLKLQYPLILDELKHQGWDDDRIAALMDATLFYPAPADLIRWQAREVFEPEMIERYGLDSEFEAIDKEPFYKAGMTDEQILNYWRAHWEHASWMQVVEMLHRGLLTEEQVWDWFRVVEIPPFWRQMLIDSAYTWPTRVDVRRWWDMRTIDETELRRLYSGMGYRGINLDNYVLWTKVYVAFPDLMARWTKGWITEDDVRAELTRLGMPADRVNEMIQTKVKPTEQEPITEAKKVSQTAIIKWVKEDIEARWEQGVDLLMDLDYDESGARFVLDAYIAEAGSPETYEDWKKITTEYKIVTGKEAKPMPEELKAAADEVVRVTKELESLEESIKEEEAKLLEIEPLPEEATAHLKELQVARNRAEAELARVKSDYDRQLAEWRYGTTK